MELTISGLIFPASRAARAAISCKSVAVKFVNFPPYVPKGVLFAATMNTSLTATETILTLHVLRTFVTRFHSSRMRTARSLISYSLGLCLPGGGLGGHLGGCGVVTSSQSDHVTYPLMHFMSPPYLDRVSDTRLWKHNLRSLRYAGGNNY